MFHLLLGDFYEAYRLYKDELQQVQAQNSFHVYLLITQLCSYHDVA